MNIFESFHINYFPAIPLRTNTIKKFMDWRVKIDTVCWVEHSNFAHCVNMEIKLWII